MTTAQVDVRRHRPHVPVADALARETRAAVALQPCSLVLGRGQLERDGLRADQRRHRNARVETHEIRDAPAVVHVG